jgi:DNA-binding Lrp family transcriptional regulator
MASIDRKAAGARAACVQGLTLPDWLRRAVEEARDKPPAGALTVEEIAKMMGLSRGQANARMKKLYEAGKVTRVNVGGRFYYNTAEK